MSPVSGARLGPYEILSPLGTGGMGEVYRAMDTRLGREVAIKVLPEAFARDPERVTRFRREAQFLAALNHPNIAAIYEFDEAKGALFLVMELVPGETLKQMLLERPLTLEEALPVARQIAEALEAAHAKSVLHRDLKPANVKVTPEKKVKLLDFGLAKAFYPASLSPDSSQSPTVAADQTRQGLIIGTAAYMSPEQARGKTLDARSDVWSFGCVLFEMLSGRKAFEGETVSDILVAILERQPDWDALPADTPPPVVELLKLALKKNVSERLEQIADARRVIEGVLGGGAPVLARQRSATYPVPASITRRPARALTVAALLVVAGVAAWIGLKSRNGTSSLPREKYLAILPFKDLTGQPDGQLIGAGMAEHLSASLARAPGVLVMPAVSAGVPATNDVDVRRLARESGANLFIIASFQREGERMRVTYSLLSTTSPAQLDGGIVEGSASDRFGLQDRVAESVLAGLRVQAGTAPASGRKGLESGSAQEDYLKALGALLRYDDPKSVSSAVALLSKIPDGGDSALVQAALGRAYLAQYSLTRDRADAEQAQKASERAVALNARLPEVRVTLGQILTATGRPKEAVAELKKAVEMQPRSAEAVLALAEAQEKAGQFAEAEAGYRRGIELRPASWAGYNKVGGFYYSRGDYARAADSFRKAIDLNPDVARPHYNLCAVLMRLGLPAEAQAECQKSIAIQPSAPAYSNLGTSFYVLGNYSGAAEAFERAVGLAPKNFRSSAYLGDALMLVPGRAADARRALTTAVALGEEELRINPTDARTRAILSRCLARLGQKARAWDEALRATREAPGDPNVLKPAAEAAAILGHRTEALRWLEVAVPKGLGTFEIEHNPHFSDLKDDPAFQALFKGPARPARSQ